MSRYHFTYYWILDQNKMQIQLHKQDDVVMSAEKSVRQKRIITCAISWNLIHYLIWLCQHLVNVSWGQCNYLYPFCLWNADKPFKLSALIYKQFHQTRVVMYTWVEDLIQYDYYSFHFVIHSNRIFTSKYYSLAE